MTNPDAGVPAIQPRRQALCGLAVALLAPGALAACGDSKPAPSGGGYGDSGGSGTGQTGGGSSSSPQTGGQGGSTLAKLSDVPVGSGKVVDGPAGKTLLLRPSASEVKAVSAVCPHAGATVSPPSGGFIKCPLHGSKFDAKTGELRGGPATEGLAPVNVTVQGEDIVAT